MKTRLLLLLVIITGISSLGYIFSSKAVDRKIEVFRSDVPYTTEKFTRIGYTLKMWEWKKEGLRLDKIVVLDNDTKAELYSVTRPDFPPVFSDPLSSSKDIKFDKIDAYYISLQLPVPLENPVPKSVCNRLILTDTVNNKEVVAEGGVFSPRINEKPLVISSPVKGTNWIFMNQSTNFYHFFTLFFMNGKVGSGERYAADLVRTNDANEFLEGNPRVNTSYFCYGDTLFAVADGEVFFTLDGLPENTGDTLTVSFENLQQYAGNHLILKLDNGYYAVYGHCIPNSLMVKKGDKVKEGTPIALLGHSGNSTMPHLHFSVNDGPDFLMSESVPYVLKQFTIVRDYENKEFKGPLAKTNSMMEEMSIVNIP